MSERLIIPVGAGFLWSGELSLPPDLCSCSLAALLVAGRVWGRRGGATGNPIFSAFYMVATPPQDSSSELSTSPGGQAMN